MISNNGLKGGVPDCPACHQFFDLDLFETDSDNYSKEFQDYLNENYIPKIKNNLASLEHSLSKLKILLKLTKDPKNEIRKKNISNSFY